MSYFFYKNKVSFVIRVDLNDELCVFICIFQINLKLKFHQNVSYDLVAFTWWDTLLRGSTQLLLICLVFFGGTLTHDTVSSRDQIFSKKTHKAFILSQGWSLFSASKGAHLLFTSNWTRLLNIMLLWEGCQSSSQGTCYLPSKSRCPFVRARVV